MRLFAVALSVATWAMAAPSISTIVGNGKAGFSAEQVNNPFGLVIGPDGALYFCDTGNHVIRRFEMSLGKITTVAGNGKKGYSGDGGPATQASLNEPYELRFDRKGNLYFVERLNHLVRRVDHRTGIITTVAGNGTPGFSGDGGPASSAQMNEPHSLVFDRRGWLLVCDIRNNRVRAINPKTGLIHTWAGTGERKATPDGASLEGTPLNGPRALDVDPKGNVFLVLREGNAVYRIDRGTSRITHLAGTGEKGYSGDGGPAVKAKLNGPKGISYSRDAIYIADTESHTIRRIDLKTGIIQSVAGTGDRGDGPEGDPLKCRLARPHGVFVDRHGAIYIGDSEAHRVRVIR